MVSGRLNPRSHFPHLRAPRPPQKAARLGPSSLKPAGQGCHPEACLLLQPHTDGHVGQPCRGETGRSSMPPEKSGQCLWGKRRDLIIPLTFKARICPPGPYSALNVFLGSLKPPIPYQQLLIYIFRVFEET